MLSSFAQVTEDGVGQLLSSFGQIQCSMDFRAIAHVSEADGVLRIFSPHGQLMVSDSIPGYMRMIWHRVNAAPLLLR